MRRILLVEDDLSLGQTLKERLSKDYEVIWAADYRQALQQFHQHPQIELAILDVGLPDGNGFDLAKELKQQRNILFLFLTAQADAQSRLTGFELGAEEYIPKPFHLKELLIRVKHVLDLHVPQKEIVLRDHTVNFADMTVQHKNGKIEYPPVNDMKILQVLIESSPRVLSRDDIINAVWGVDKMPSHRTVDNIIVRLRQLLGDEDGFFIRSIRGIGYQWLQKEES